MRDANGNVLADGDSVTVIKDLKVKGSSLVVKVGTKVKNIRLVEGDHDIDCRIDGIGAMQLKSEFVKKAYTASQIASREPDQREATRNMPRPATMRTRFMLTAAWIRPSMPVFSRPRSICFVFCFGHETG